MDFSNRRYSKPKVLKKRKDLNKYKLRNVSKDKFEENPPLPLDKPVLGARGTAVAGPALSKLNRNERLTVKRGLFQRSQKSQVVYRNMVNRSEQVARLNEDLDALIPSDDDHDASSPYLYEQNNNVPKPLSPAVEVMWQTQPNSDKEPIPHTLKSPSPSYNRPRRSVSPASKPVSSNHNRARPYVSPASKTASSNNNRSLRASRSLDQRSLTLTRGSQDSPDPYPRTRAYVNAQRELMAKRRANAFELSSESEEVEIAEEKPLYSPSQLNPEMISKYIELVTFVEKKFVQVKKEVFKEAPCNDYFKKLRNELWDSYQRCGQASQQGESSNSKAPPHDTGQNECETVSLSSEDSQDLEQAQGPQQNEFVFSPNLCPRNASPTESVFPTRTEEEHSSVPAHRFLDNESYDDRSRRPHSYSPTHSRYFGNASHYHDNCTHYYPPGGSSSVHRPRVRSPDLTTFSTKRYRSSSYQSSAAGRDCRDLSGYRHSARGVVAHVLNPNSRPRVAYDPQYYGMTVTSSNDPDSLPLDPNDIDDNDESPPMNFYPRKLF